MQLIFAVVVLAICGFIIYKNFVSNKTSSELLINPALSNQSVDAFKKAAKVLDDAKFKNLIKFGNWPVTAGEKGRANPFIKL